MSEVSTIYDLTTEEAEIKINDLCDKLMTYHRELLKLRRVFEAAVQWSTMGDSSLRLRMGGMTTQEMRAVRAVLSTILDKYADGSKT